MNEKIVILFQHKFILGVNSEQWTLQLGIRNMWRLSLSCTLSAVLRWLDFSVFLVTYFQYFLPCIVQQSRLNPDQENRGIPSPAENSKVLCGTFCYLSDGARTKPFFVSKFWVTELNSIIYLSYDLWILYQTTKTIIIIIVYHTMRILASMYNVDIHITPPIVQQ